MCVKPLFCLVSLFIRLCICLFISAYISSLCVFVCFFLFITTLMSSYFSTWPVHSARLAFAISEWLCPLFFHNYFHLMTLHFCIKSTIKIVVVVVGSIMKIIMIMMVNIIITIIFVCMAQI